MLSIGEESATASRSPREHSPTYDDLAVIQPLRIQSEIVSSTLLVSHAIDRFSRDAGDMGPDDLVDLIGIIKKTLHCDVAVVGEPTIQFPKAERLARWWLHCKGHFASNDVMALKRIDDQGSFRCIFVVELEGMGPTCPILTIILQRIGQIFSVDEVVCVKAVGRIFSNYCYRMYSADSPALENKLRSVIAHCVPTDWLLKTLVYSHPGHNILLDNNGCILSGSRMANDAFEMDSAADGLSWLATLVHPDDLKTVVSQVKEAMQSKSHMAVDCRLFDKDGASARSYHMSLRPLEHKQEIKWWLIALVDKNRRKSVSPIPRMLFAEMAHEIRTPLSCIIGTASLLDFSPLNSEQKELTHTIKTCGQQLLNLLNGILDITRIDYSKMLLEYANVCLERVIYEATEIVYSEGILKNLVLVVDIEDSCPERVVIDEQRLRQIIGNLLANAVRYSPEGSVVRLRIYKSAEDFESKRMTLRVSVQDYGVGIKEEESERLFKAFSQTGTKAPGATGSVGSGLGLAICKKLVNLMGGEIWFESHPGEGTTFFFTIQLTTDLSSYPVKPESFVPSKQALRSLREYLGSLRTAYDIFLHLVFETQALGDFVAQKLDQLDLFIQLERHDSFDDVEIGNTAFDKGKTIEAKTGRVHIILTDVNIVWLLGQDKYAHWSSTSNVSLIQIGKCANEEKDRERQVICLRDPLKLTQLYRTMQESLLTSIYRISVPATEATQEYQHRMQQVQDNTRMEPLAERFPLNIMVVDDDNVSKQMFIKFLGKLGYEATVYHAGDGREAVNRCQQLSQLHAPIDVIFMDIQMPFVDGFEATRMIRADRTIAKQPHILALTAGILEPSTDTTGEPTGPFADAGMCHVLSKPVPMARLEGILRDAYECVGHKSCPGCSGKNN